MCTSLLAWHLAGNLRLIDSLASECFLIFVLFARVFTILSEWFFLWVFGTNLDCFASGRRVAHEYLAENSQNKMTTEDELRSGAGLWSLAISNHILLFVSFGLPHLSKHICLLFGCRSLDISGWIYPDLETSNHFDPPRNVAKMRISLWR